LAEELFSQQPIVMRSPVEASIVFSISVCFADIVYHVTQDGWNFIGNEDVGKLIWETKQREGGFSMIPS
jgi:hypothetical protein